MPTQLHLHERAGDAAAGLGKVPGSNNLRKVKAPTDQTSGVSDAAMVACVTMRTLTSMMYLALFFSCNGSKLSERMISGCST